MAYLQIEETLHRALTDRYPNAKVSRQITTTTNFRVDIALELPGKRVAFEVKMSNFYDALGRTVLWAKEFDAIYIVIPQHIVPVMAILSRLPYDIGVIAFQTQDKSIKFEIARQSKGYEMPEFVVQMPSDIIPQLSKRIRTSLVSPKALRVIKYLISHRRTTQVQIAGETQVSAGMVNRVIAALTDRGLISYNRKDLVVQDVWRLLNEVSWNRTLNKLKKGEIYVNDVDSTTALEAKFVQICNETKTKYAFTLFSGATKYIGYGAKYDSVQAYAEVSNLFLQRMDHYRGKVHEGIVLEIYTPDTWDIIEESKLVGGQVVCSPAQLVLDLVSYGHVGRDWAVKLYEAVIAEKE